MRVDDVVSRICVSGVLFVAQEKERLAELLQQSNEQMREFVIDRLPEKEAALQILQDAQRDLKKQFSRLEGRASDMHRRLERMHQEKVQWGDWECGGGGQPGCVLRAGILTVTPALVSSATSDAATAQQEIDQIKNKNIYAQ